MIHTCLLVLLTLGLSPATVFAQDVLQNAEDVIQHYFEASGGDKLASVQTMRMSGRYTFRGIDYPITIVKMRPAFFRFEIIEDRKREILGFDGEVAWQISDSDSAQAKPVEHPLTRAYIEAHADFDGPLVNHERKGHQVVLNGIEMVDGDEAYRLDLTRAGGGRETWFISTASFLPVKRSVKLDLDDGEFVQNYYYLDFQTTGGIVLPHYTERTEAHYVHNYEIEDVELGPELDTKPFKMLEKND